MNVEKVFDEIILGGGIAGLYAAYEISKKHPTKTILLVEKSNVLGGRVKTYRDENMLVEAGAGRFHNGNKLLIALIKELGLGKSMKNIPKSDIYYDVKTKTPIENPNTPLLKRLLENIPENIRSMNILQYASNVLSKEEIKVLEDSFGYYTELVDMNAHDFLVLWREHLASNVQYHYLEGGLGQIIEKLMEKLAEKKRTITVLKNYAVSDISKGEDRYVVHFHNRKITYSGKHIISALPKQVLEKMAFFTPIHRILQQSIHCGSLCRIYSIFPKDKENKVWFEKIPKFTTNNNLRIVIPINSEKGIIMSSYTDSKFSKYWKQIYEKGGSNALNKELVKQLKESTGIDNIPMPKETQIFYWECGVGYWKVGINSTDISGKITRPFLEENVFICGEHFSEKNQQWIEGALQTSKKVVDIL
jgi:monoamine oxidase